MIGGHKYLFLALVWSLSLRALAQQPHLNTVSIDWSKPVATSKIELTLQFCPYPQMRGGNPLHDKVFKAMRDLNANYDRFQPWFEYPRMYVAELDPPSNGKTHWDFTLMDQVMDDFIKASNGKPVVMNIGAVPAWMYKTKTPVSYPKDPDQIDRNYAAKGELTDETIELYAEYQARIVGWYLNGGFKDEYGAWHKSNHHYTNVAYWEVLNEPDMEHYVTPENYVRFYDATVEAVRKVAPTMKFGGTSVADTAMRPDYTEYFLNPANHKPGIPIDLLAYHLYSSAELDETPQVRQFTFFQQADRLVSVAAYVETLRKRYAPKAFNDAEETGAFVSAYDGTRVLEPITNFHWRLSAATLAYFFANMAALGGVDALGVSELLDYPTQTPGLSLLDWDTGEPNLRYRVLQLLRENFPPGVRVFKVKISDNNDAIFLAPNYFAQGFMTADGVRKILLVNKREKSTSVVVPGGSAGEVEVVDQSTPNGTAKRPMKLDSLTLDGFAVSVVTLPK